VTLASAQYQDLSRFSKNLKRVYANKIGDLTPTEDLASKLVPFTDGAEKVGDVYQMPFMMTREGGFTFKGGSGSGGVYRLNAPRAYATERAEISGCETTGRTAVSYKTITSAMGGDKRSFVNATKQSMARLVSSASFFRDVHIIHGGGASQVSNLGVVESVTDNTGTVDVVITAATWCTALWAGSEGLEYDGYNGATKRNSAGTDANGDTVYKLQTVAPTTRTLRFASHATNTAAIVAGDTLLFAGAYTQECLGLLGACQTSGSLWGISNTDYYLWKPKAVSVGGAMGYEKLQEGIAKVAEIGWSGTMHVLVNPYTWQDICDDMSSLIRITDKTSGEVTFGIDKPTFKGQTGKVVLHAYKYMKQGEALGIPGEACMRVGSTDITLDIPGGKGDMVMHLPDYTGVEFRCFDDQAPFCDSPGGLIRWSGIVNRKSA
jgi:hypothetical protein